MSDQENAYNELINPLTTSTNRINDIIGKLSDSLLTCVNQLNESYYTAFQNSLLDSIDALSIAISSIKIDSLPLPLRNVDTLEKSFEKWGEFGWTMPPDSPPELFFNCPTESFEADEIIEKYCKTENLELLFSQLKMTSFNQADLDEAIFCFLNEKYKSCALVLFGAIDSEFIKRQTKAPNKRRSVGLGAIMEFKDSLKIASSGLELKTPKEVELYTLLWQKNILTFLCEIFKYTNDFELDEKIINRHSISHGMNFRNVIKRDCIQLFIGLYNISDFIAFTAP